MSEFADITGLSSGNISGLEGHKYEPSFKAITKIIELFDISPQWLITGKGEAYIKEASSTAGTSSNVISLERSKFVYQFEDKKLAEQLSKRLLEIEQLDKAALQSIADKVEGMLEGLKRSAQKNKKIAELKAQLAAAKEKARDRGPDSVVNET